MTTDLTLVRDAIHNPTEPRHFMRLARPTHRVIASLAGVTLASSTRVIKLKEVARDIYDPVCYFPREDVDMSKLARIEKSTHCPLKGDTEYFDARVDGAPTAEAAWSYNRTLPFAQDIQNYVAFDTRRVQVTEFTTSE